LGQVVHLDFDVQAVRHPALGPAHSLADRSGERHVIVFDENARAEVEAVVAAAAHAHGVFFQKAKPRSGLARVGDAQAGALGCGHKGSRQRGNSGEPLQEN